MVLGRVSLHGELGWGSSQNCPLIMSSYQNHTEDFTWKAAGSEIRNRSAAGLAPCLVAAGFSQPVFCWPVTGYHPPPSHFQIYLFWSWQSPFGDFFNSQDPVYLLTSNYSCAELLKNEMSSNKHSGCPLTYMLSGYFASSQLFSKQQLFGLLS